MTSIEENKLKNGIENIIKSLQPQELVEPLISSGIQLEPLNIEIFSP